MTSAAEAPTESPPPTLPQPPLLRQSGAYDDAEKASAPSEEGREEGKPRDDARGDADVGAFEAAGGIYSVGCERSSAEVASSVVTSSTDYREEESAASSAATAPPPPPPQVYPGCMRQHPHRHQSNLVNLALRHWSFYLGNMLLSYIRKETGNGSSTSSSSTSSSCSQAAAAAESHLPSNPAMTSFCPCCHYHTHVVTQQQQPQQPHHHHHQQEQQPAPQQQQSSHAYPGHFNQTNYYGYPNHFGPPYYAAFPFNDAHQRRTGEFAVSVALRDGAKWRERWLGVKRRRSIVPWSTSIQRGSP